MTPTLTSEATSAKADVVIDTYHGVEVADPFRWLEDLQSERTHTWIDAQAAVCRGYLDGRKGREINAARIEQLLEQQVIAEIRKTSSFIYFTRREPGEEQAKIYRRNGLEGADELLLDPETFNEGNSLSLSILDISPKGRYLAYGLRTGGEGARRVEILDLETRATLPDKLAKGGVRGFSFLPEDAGFIYVTERVGQPDDPRMAKRHLFGQPPEDDKKLFYAGRGRKVRLLSGIDRDSSLAIHTVIRYANGENLTSVYVQKATECGASIMTLAESVAGSFDLRVHQGHAYIMAGRKNGVGRELLRVPLDDPDLDQARTIATEGGHYIESWFTFGDRLVLGTVENLASALRLYTTDGEFLETVALPEPGTANVIEGDREGFFFSFQSSSRPAEVYYYDFASRKTSLFGARATTAERIVIQRTEYTSDDGTTIPLTLIGRQEILDSRNSPVLLTAYGASGMCLTPQFSPLVTRFAELGGIFAIAHIRGGGELGPAWHEAGDRRNRPLVNADFVSAAEFLIDSGIAGRDRVAIAGGSNSGLLVATAMTQRPDLFRAVICLVPITDMLRYHLFNTTPFYIPQYGSSDDPDDFRMLLSYSPYHNVHEGVRYPALLMTSGDNDTRCNPMHACKFVARIQAAAGSQPGDHAQQSAQPALLDWNALRGHFPTLPHSVRAKGILDRILFLCHHLGMQTDGMETDGMETN
jgi:prolyl oligopeptidase